MNNYRIDRRGIIIIALTVAVGILVGCGGVVFLGLAATGNLPSQRPTATATATPMQFCNVTGLIKAQGLPIEIELDIPSDGMSRQVQIDQTIVSFSCTSGHLLYRGMSQAKPGSISCPLAGNVSIPDKALWELPDIGPVTCVSGTFVPKNQAPLGPTNTPAPTDTPVPTNTPAPTASAIPTNTPAPTATMVPTATSLPAIQKCGLPTPDKLGDSGGFLFPGQSVPGSLYTCDPTNSGQWIHN